MLESIDIQPAAWTRLEQICIESVVGGNSRQSLRRVQRRGEWPESALQRRGRAIMSCPDFEQKNEELVWTDGLRLGSGECSQSGKDAA